MEREVAMALHDAFEADLDPIPAALSQFAFDALQWRLIDEELAAITFDSSTDELVGIRGTATLRHAMRFEGGGIAVSVSVTDSAFVASIEPPAVYSCRIEGPQTHVDVRSDEHGQFAIGHSQLPVRLVIELEGGGLFVSPWITG
jgi:hypothetical protein